MSTLDPIRAALARLVELNEGCTADHWHAAILAARAALAEPDPIRAALERLVKELNEYDPKWDAFPEDALAAARAALDAAPNAEPEPPPLSLAALVGGTAAAVTPSGGYEPGRGAMDGAQMVNGEWWEPEFGCDSLDQALDAIRARLVTAITDWYGKAIAARAALEAAPADGPAVPEGREPAAVADEPSPTTPPAPAAGEVGELVAWLREQATWFTADDPGHESWDRAADLLEQFSAQVPQPVAGEVGELVAWMRAQITVHETARTQWAKRFTRAAALLEQLSSTPPTPQPVAVAVRERLRHVEDLAADAVSALRYIEQSHGRLYGVGWDRVYEKADRLRPAHALPLPTTTPAGQEGADG